jgi:hypothetical protein
MVKFKVSLLIFWESGWAVDKMRVLMSPTIILSGSVSLCIVMFVLWNWVYQCLLHMSLQLLHLLFGLFSLLICSDLLYLVTNFFFFFFFWYWGLKSGPTSKATPPVLFCEGFFEIGSRKLFAWAGFELQSSWCLPPE